MNTPTFKKRVHAVIRDDIAGVLQYARRDNGAGQVVTDMSSARIVHAGFDTVESYYKGDLKIAKIEHLSRLFQRLREQGQFDPIVKFNGEKWKMRPGGASGYRWSLQSRKLGLQVFFSNSKFKEDDATPSHVKIVASPNFLLDHTHEQAVAVYDDLAGRLLQNATRHACGAHLCVDVSGVELDHSYVERMYCHAKLKRGREGVDYMAYSGSNTVMTYKGIQSVTFGNRQLQLQIYDKTQWADEENRNHYWHTIWGRNCEERYHHPWHANERQVWRFELRLSHKVILEMEAGSGVGLRDQIEVAAQARAIWQYGLNNFRLDATREFVDPLWQYLAEEVHTFDRDEPVQILRHYAYSAGMPFERTLKLAIAYTTKAWVQQGQGYDAIRMNLVMTGLYGPFVVLCRERGLEPDDVLRDRVERLQIDGEESVCAPGDPGPSWDHRIAEGVYPGDCH